MIRCPSVALLLTLLVLAIPTRGQADPHSTLRRIVAERAKAAEEAGVFTVLGEEGWMYGMTELRHLAAGPFWGAAAATASRATREDTRDPLPAIVDFHQQLTQLGIHLIFVPVPAKAVIYPEGLGAPPSDDRLDPDHVTFYEKLREAGVDVLDLTPVFRVPREDGRLWYCRTDTHWAPAACEEVAVLLAERIRAVEGLGEFPARDLITERRAFEIHGDLARLAKPPQETREALSARFVTDRATGEAPQSDPASPVVVLGDSHNLVFQAGGDMHVRGAGLSDQLMAELKGAVHTLGVRGSGATPSRINFIRQARRDPEYLKGKKVVVWCLTVWEFTETTGWSRLPILAE